MRQSHNTGRRRFMTGQLTPLSGTKSGPAALRRTSAFKRTPTAPWTSTLDRRRPRIRNRTGFLPAPPGNLKFSSASTAPRSRCSTRLGGCRTSRRFLLNDSRVRIMKNCHVQICAGLLLATTSFVAFGQSQSGNAVFVTADNFVRAETDLYFGAVVKKDGFGKFEHNREALPIDKQTVIRTNRDTLYSGAVFDLDAGPVTITLPDAGARFMSMQVFDEDEYTPLVVYDAGPY